MTTPSSTTTLATTSPDPNVPDTTTTLSVGKDPVWTQPAFFLAFLPTVIALVGYFTHKPLDLPVSDTAIAAIAAAVASVGYGLFEGIKHHGRVHAAGLAGGFESLVAAMEGLVAELRQHGTPVPGVVSAVTHDLQDVSSAASTVIHASVPGAVTMTTTSSGNAINMPQVAAPTPAPDPTITADAGVALGQP